MKIWLGLLLVAALAAPAFAEDDPKPKVEVIARDANGKATRVKIGEFEYALCSKTVTDGCINPRDAGFDWGGVELDYWPGKPASQIEGKKPASKPDEAKSG
jgi:hypothetical protein